MEESNDLGDWKKVSILGSGAFGVVALWRHNPTNDYVAIKKCRWDQPENIPPKARDRWTQEVEFMKTVQHTNIVSYKKLPVNFHTQLERYNLSRLPLLPMEYCSGGNLRRLLSQPRNACGLREVDVRRILDDVSQAVSYLHRLKITHRDIKPENVVLQKGDKGIVIYKLIDLGYAKDMDLLVSFVGTLGYTAPEIFKNEDYSHNVDYWSFGILAYEICCGKHPFLPKLPPVQRFKLIAKKGPRDICVYQSQLNTIVFTDKILEPNHVSACFRTHLEDWLGAMLEYNGDERGKTQQGGDVFAALRSILHKPILHVFSVYNYANYYYEFNASTRFAEIQRLIHENTDLDPDELLIITTPSHASSDFYKRILNPQSLLQKDLGLSSLSTLAIFKRNEFVRTEQIILPLAVRNLLQNGKQQWDQLIVQTSQAVHYIEEEINNMRALKCAVNEFHEYLRMLLTVQGQDDLLPKMRAEGQRVLQLVEFCKEMNAVCQYDSSKQDAIKNYRKHLWRVRELIENVNAATVRHLKLRTRSKLLKASFDKVTKWSDEMNIDKIYEDAMSCLNINKQKANITADSIAVVICSTLRARKEIQHNNKMTQHIQLGFKVLREHDKLTRWMKALTGQLRHAASDLLDAQKSLSKSDGGGNLQIRGEVRGKTFNHYNAGDAGNLEDENTSSADDLIKDNRLLRSKMQEVLGGLLVTHKDHAVCVGEFVEFVDGLNYNDDKCP